jgi:hypothetical protein
MTERETLLAEIAEKQARLAEIDAECGTWCGEAA